MPRTPPCRVRPLRRVPYKILSNQAEGEGEGRNVLHDLSCASNSADCCPCPSMLLATLHEASWSIGPMTGIMRMPLLASANYNRDMHTETHNAPPQSPHLRIQTSQPIPLNSGSLGPRVRISLTWEEPPGPNPKSL